MRISHFFIDRPIFASVLVDRVRHSRRRRLRRLPVAQYPEIAPPIINVTGQYSGASAETVAETVVAPIEQSVNGVEGMLYVSSNSTADGKFSISVTFDVGTDLDIAQVQVQNRVSSVTPRLPQAVQQVGVTVAKSSPDILMVVNLFSPDNSRDTLFMSNYANLEITDALTRVDGVGSLVDLRRARLRHAGLARSRPAAIAQPDRGRCRLGAAGAERAGRLRRAQSAAGAQSACFPGRGPHARPSDDAGGVRQHRRQADRNGGGAAQGCRAGRTCRAELCVEFLSRPQSVGGGGGVPAPGLERAQDRRQYPQPRWPRWRRISRKG